MLSLLQETGFRGPEGQRGGEDQEWAIASKKILVSDNAVQTPLRTYGERTRCEREQHMADNRSGRPMVYDVIVSVGHIAQSDT
jgi:hypothetical protein